MATVSIETYYVTRWWFIDFFGYGGLVGLGLLSIVQLALRPDRFTHAHSGFWHIHDHDRACDQHHQHKHPAGSATDSKKHRYAHYHDQFSHVHADNDISHNYG